MKKGIYMHVNLQVFLSLLEICTIVSKHEIIPHLGSRHLCKYLWIMHDGRQVCFISTIPYCIKTDLQYIWFDWSYFFYMSLPGENGHRFWEIIKRWQFSFSSLFLMLLIFYYHVLTFYSKWKRKDFYHYSWLLNMAIQNKPSVKLSCI